MIFFCVVCVCHISDARLAQMVERMTLNHVVAGSIPAVGDFTSALLFGIALHI